MFSTKIHLVSFTNSHIEMNPCQKSKKSVKWMNCTGISGAICILSWLVCMPLIVKQLKREINKNKSKEIRYYRISNIKGKLNTNPHKSIHFAIYNLFFCAACFCFFFIRCILFSILLLWRFFLFLYLQCAFSIIDILLFLLLRLLLHPVCEPTCAKIL